MGVNCTPLAGAPLANIHMKVDSIERGVGVSHSIAFFHVTLDDWRTGYIMTSDLLAHGTDSDPVKAAADCKRHGDPYIGMTAKHDTVLARCRFVVVGHSYNLPARCSAGSASFL
jgi:hypothetical protein